ncbi:uncharacterized protein SRS1_06028 [Sporisorium reilianum f. sp. reilianum]|uniref:Uncharacterized protein n=1 Tax=Sporisorium reilianum f. sp. reilianum TaxID=72559 RepID=A0A2N8UHF0_9BASI|nr:uncharacterized protein SRS1_06028 [Sporisorium reilianum f. sp. reilianum]
MQPLDVSIFGPLTATYRRIINDVSEHVGTINKAQFTTFYAQAREKIFERLPVQDLAILQTNATLNVMLNAFCQEPNRRDADRLKHMVMKAHKEVHARNLVLEFENMLLWQQEDQSKRIVTKVKWKERTGDWMVLSKDKMITHKYAERELVTKKPAIAANRRKHRQKKCWQEEEEVVAPPPATADDGDEALLTSPPTPSPPPMQKFLDELNDGKPLSAITDGDDDPFGFFDTLPQPSPSCTQR